MAVYQFLPLPPTFKATPYITHGSLLASIAPSSTPQEAPTEAMRGTEDQTTICPAPCRKPLIVSLVMHFCAEHLHAAVVAAKVPPATSDLAPLLAALLTVNQDGDAFHMQAIIQILPWLESTPKTITLLKDVRLQKICSHIFRRSSPYFTPAGCIRGPRHTATLPPCLSS